MLAFTIPARYTQEFMAKYDTFTVSFFPESYRKALGYLGSHSGRDEDKVANSGLTLVAAGNGVTFCILKLAKIAGNRTTCTSVK